MQSLISYYELIRLLLSKKIIIAYGVIGIGIQSITIRVLLNYCVVNDTKVLFINCDDWLLKLFNKEIKYNSHLFAMKGEYILSGFKLINIIFSFLFLIYSAIYYLFKFLKINKNSRRSYLVTIINQKMKSLEYKCDNRFNLIVDNKNHNTYYLLNQLGIYKDDWFVCLHVRDNLFYGSDSGANLRNSKIDNYAKAIELISDAGGKVVRLGSASSKNHSIKYSHANLIDYPNSEVKSDFLDLHLIKNCSFYIGTTSGPMDVAELFNKNILTANIYPDIFNYLHQKTCSGITKHLMLDNSKIKISDIFKYYEYYFNHPWDSEDRDNFVFVDNTDEEILQLVHDYLDRINSNYFKLSDLQIEFNNRLIGCIKSMKVTNSTSYYNLLYARLNLNFSGSISNSFLQNNW
jgi:putative glycosyltransferase (TIGR04372 family)